MGTIKHLFTDHWDNSKSIITLHANYFHLLCNREIVSVSVENKLAIVLIASKLVFM